jgi:hypothetical protein
VDDLVALFERLVHLHGAIHQSKEDMDLAHEQEHSDTQPVWYHAPSDETSPFPYDCEFVNHSVACTVVLNWGLAIHVNEVMRHLHGRLAKLDAAPANAKGMVDRAEEQSRRYADDICGSIAYAQRFAPLGSGFLAYSVCLAWRFVPEHARGWMLDELNRMNGSTMNCYQAAWLDVISDMFVS